MARVSKRQPVAGAVVKRKRGAAPRKRTVLEWAPDDPIFLDLEDRKARARGKRLRQLALLGLRAEQQGLRLDAADTLVLPATLLATNPVAAAVAAPSPPPDGLDQLAQSLLGFT